MSISSALFIEANARMHVHREVDVMPGGCGSVKGFLELGFE